jgi:conserved hypothetical nucleotide-binding protein
MKAKLLTLNSMEDTENLAKELAPLLENQVVFLMGTLGSGKTTFVRHLVAELPGGGNAEVASPSFTLCNIYPTTPEVLHYDLYRLPPGSHDESLEEALDKIENSLGGASSEKLALLVEWAENMPEILVPDNRLEIYWHILPKGREVIIKGVGDAAKLPIF